MRDQLVSLVVEKLKAEKERAREQFLNTTSVQTRHFYVDNLLPKEIADKIHSAFPEPSKMRLLDSHRECKYTSKDYDEYDSILKDMTFAIQSPEVIAVIEEITGIENQEADPELYAGGLSMMTKGQFLNPHLDNSHDRTRKLYRTANVLYYVSPEWREEDGGHIELWNEDVSRQVVIPSLFNRLVVMETNPHSWHSVCEVKKDGARCCVSNYYFSEKSPIGREYFNVTSFMGRPEQPFLRVASKLDNAARMAVRKVFKFGVGKKDIYQPKA